MQNTKPKSKLKIMLLLMAAVLVLSISITVLPGSGAQPVKAAAASPMAVDMVQKEFNFGPITVTYPMAIPVPGLTKENYVDFVITSGVYKFYEKDNWQGSVLLTQNINSFNYTEVFPNPHLKEWLTAEGNSLVIGFHITGSYYGRVKIESLTGFIRYMQPAEPVVVEHSVLFEVNGGTVDGGGALSQKIVSGNYVINPPVVKHSGKTFDGWVLSGTSIVRDLSTYKITSNTIFTAKWSDIPVETCTLTLDFGEGKYNGQSQMSVTLTVGTSYILPQDAFRTGFNFLGFRDEVAQKSYTYEIIVTKNTTLKAVWSYVNFYTVTFSVGADARIVDGDLTQHVTLNDRAVSPEVERDGYVFNGWMLANGQTVFPDTYPITKDTVFYAIWLDNYPSYTVTFDIGEYGTRVSGGALTQELEWGQKPVYPVLQPKESRYKFLGWSTSKTSSKVIDTKTFVGYGVTALYAVWDIPQLCKVEFVASEGGGLVSLQPFLLSGNLIQNVYAGEYLVVPVLKDREGLIFYGWSVTLDTPPLRVYDDNELSGYVIMGDCKIIAQWIPATYSLTFDTNGGVRVGGGALEQKNIPMFTACEPPVLKKDGFIFLGWRIPGSTRIYSNDELVFVTGSYIAAWGFGFTVTNNLTEEKLVIPAEVVNDKYKFSIDYFKGTVMDRVTSNQFIAFNLLKAGHWTNGKATKGEIAEYGLKSHLFDNFLMYMYGQGNTKFNAHFFDFDLPADVLVRSLHFLSSAEFRIYVYVNELGEYIFERIDVITSSPSVMVTYEDYDVIQAEIDDVWLYEWWLPVIFFGLSALLLVAAFVLISKGYGKEGSICLLIALVALGVCVGVFLL